MQATSVLRAARLDELPQIADFWLAMFQEAGIWRESDFAMGWRARFVAYFSRRIDADDVRYFVATDNTRLVGTAGAMLLEYPAIVNGLRFGYIFGVRVDPAFRGGGIATALTRETIAYLKGKNCRRIRLHASPAGRPVYERLGFVPTNEMDLPLG